MEEIEKIFHKIKNESDWNINLASIFNSKVSGTKYHIDKLNEFENDGEKDIINDILSNYDIHELERKYSCVEEYKGTIENNKIYKIATEDKFLKEEYNSLLDAMAEGNTENINLKKKKYDFTIFNAIKSPLMIISVGEPITNIKNGFIFDGSAFKRVPSNFLTIKNKIDIVVYEKEIFIFSNAAERVFNFERSFKKIAKEYVDEIIKCNIVNDSDFFASISATGHNPRKMINFNHYRLNKMANDQIVLKNVAKKCKLKLDGDKVDTTDPANSELLIKILCDKVQEDLFDHIPVEVDSSKVLFKE